MGLGGRTVTQVVPVGPGGGTVSQWNRKWDSEPVGLGCGTVRQVVPVGPGGGTVSQWE